MALGRVVSAATNRKPGRYPAIFIVLEFVVAAMIANTIKGL
jgi:hypothetical protein